ncbi:hypothetical protein F511_19184 [Dorcoceras hygrometricum]|uniref:Uncharacterized protein n=1 Tax=Dorcoceras hygrometricum TaxID=472368 RepID=A0A2Z7A9K9_9LAMI|nr:hypothetical protein F511_19184 [Dorcoceras hygrometricum]
MPVAIVKRASKLKKKSESTSDATVEIVSDVVGSKKRPEIEGSEPVVPKKRQTTKSKASVSSANMDMASVTQVAVPLQVIEPTPTVTTEKPPAPKRKSRKRRLILSEGSDDDNVEESIDVESVKVAGVNVEELIEKVSHVSEQVAPTTDEVDVIIGQILTETSKLTTDDTESGEQIFIETDVGDIAFGDSTADNPEELAQWLENYISEGAEQVNESDSDRVQGTMDTVDDEQLFETANVEEAEGSKNPVVEEDLAKAVGSKQVAEEHMSIDDLLLQISDDMMLPSVTAAEITKIRLGESISINEVKEHDLYFASLPRISLHDKGKENLEEDEPVKGNPARETVALICRDVDFLVQLRDKGIYTDSFVGYYSDSDVQSVSDFEESSSDGSTVYRSPSPLRDFQFALGPIIFGVAQEEQLYFVQSPESPPATSPHQESYSSTDVSMHFDSEDISLNARADIQPSLPIDSTVFTAALDDLRMSILQRINDSNSDMFSKKEVQELNAKVDIMATKFEIVKKDVEATKEAISHQLLEFQTQAQANHIVLTDQLGQLVDYINRGGNAKKGEGESSRGPQPPPAVQIRDSSISGGNVVRTTELTQANIDAANRQNIERMMREDREREREKRSRSGSYKRRRY